MLDFTMPHSADPKLITQMSLSAQSTLDMISVNPYRGELYQHASQRIHELMHHRSHQAEY